MYCLQSRLNFWCGRWSFYFICSLWLGIFPFFSLQSEEISRPKTTVSQFIDQTKAVFPLERYSQAVDEWISPYSSKYEQPLMSEEQQQALLKKLYEQYYGTETEHESPWNAAFIKERLIAQGPDTIALLEERIANRYTSKEALYYGENFKLKPSEWKKETYDNVQIGQFYGLAYQPKNHAITVNEALVRALPTYSPAFSSVELPGQGYPFDLLQMSAIRPATPLYILGTSRDQAWTLVLAPELIGWVNSEYIARADSGFIQRWRTAAAKQLGAFTKEPVAVTHSSSRRFLFSARIGTFLPIASSNSSIFSVMVPVSDENGEAQIRLGSVSSIDMETMPLRMTPKNFSRLMKVLINKPYGWGNLYHHNDCSAELRNLMLPFGLFLPRNSAYQADAGSKLDLSRFSMPERLQYLVRNGAPFLDLIFIGGHVMLYIGNALLDGQEVPITYQNLWALAPRDKKWRAIVGQSAIFPLLPSYPEMPALQSLADKDRFIITRISP